MPNLELLQSEIDNSGMKFCVIAEKSGMVRQTLYNKLKGKGEFTASDISGLSSTLNFTKKKRDEIFFD